MVSFLGIVIAELPECSYYGTVAPLQSSVREIVSLEAPSTLHSARRLATGKDGVEQIWTPLGNLKPE